ncbi:hypothetical protein C7K38_00915 [Tetragenococcus osmophilus]|uniref:DUF2178 domain-containing protein n=1 Tax=Tetragenococcus osmophilus TaxID=526944 RepID=A0AA37XJ80_9ENTE|nr:hypothetical protein [Tetragenococcus osmophilus]AYW47053.1 hypothetical protein C7K38_00915 [Tetragenococcus osmophilus]GMA55121.1 hypothetical protein GCM10025857_64780 [Alicyclobacillus contaminans]GMA71106.1 hypothetical protein GCM10025885_01550 [Tetragenococcus osmophilus]
MVNAGIIAFVVLLLVLLILDVAMLFSLGKQGDERRQMIVGKASTSTLGITMGSLVIEIVVGFIEPQFFSSGSPFSFLTVAAAVYFISLLYYKRKFGG